MGDLLGAAVLVIILMVVVSGVIYFLTTSQKDREAKTEVVKDALTPRAVRLLDRILANPDASFMLNETDRQEAQAIVNAFYQH